MFAARSVLHSISKISSNIGTRGICLTSQARIDRRNYDNQVFYDNVKFGYKQGKQNVRNRNIRRHDTGKNAFQKLTRVRVVDNSELGNRPYHRDPRVIHCYTRTRFANTGQMVLLAICGEKHKAFIVGQKGSMGYKMAKQDSNNVIILKNDGNPAGTRITVPIPSWLRSHKPTRYNIQMSKIIAIAGRFV